VPHNNATTEPIIKHESSSSLKLRPKIETIMIDPQSTILKNQGIDFLASSPINTERNIPAIYNKK